jgi:hypothetical protein
MARRKAPQRYHLRGKSKFKLRHYPRLDIGALREKTKLSYIEKKGQPMTQYDHKGKRIAIYPAFNVAARATGIIGADISTVISGRRRSAGGYIWKKGRAKPASTSAITRSGNRGVAKGCR